MTLLNKNILSGFISNVIKNNIFKRVCLYDFFKFKGFLFALRGLQDQVL